MIYKLTIPNFDNLRDELVVKIREAVSDLCNWEFGPTPTGALELVSAAVTALIRDKIVEALMREQVQCQVQDLESEFIHAVTNAPESYDYPGMTIPLDFAPIQDEWGKTERHVAIRKTQYEYQKGRYSSGLYQTRAIS